ncbi:cell wall-binding repeat-containing protein [Kineococcus sp. SYSU DK003]|uniref:cell wall-binding repeat-containing protein n=1 Tax=Kineococcus sp. SYSU DK003 TaxID=3383124 RepID=UPI003D7CEA37
MSTPFAYEGTVRAAGGDRYATAAALSRGSFAPSPGSSVFLTSGEDFADALAAGPAAAVEDAPLLLTAARTLPEATRAELTRLRPERVHVIGGVGRVGEEVLAAVRAVLPGASVDRTAGGDRYATAVAVARTFFPGQQDSFVLAQGNAFADAVSGAALAGGRAEPLLLTAPTDVPDVLASWLSDVDAGRVTVVGGTSSVPQEVVREVDLFLSAVDAVQRLAGGDRYETSAAVARSGHPEAEVAVFATGQNFPDALAAVPAAAVNSAPLLLVPGTCTPASTGAYLSANTYLRGTIVVGDEGVLTASSTGRTC